MTFWLWVVGYPLVGVLLQRFVVYPLWARYAEREFTTLYPNGYRWEYSDLVELALSAVFWPMTAPIWMVQGLYRLRRSKADGLATRLGNRIFGTERDSE